MALQQRTAACSTGEVNALVDFLHFLHFLTFAGRSEVYFSEKVTYSLRLAGFPNFLSLFGDFRDFQKSKKCLKVQPLLSDGG